MTERAIWVIYYTTTASLILLVVGGAYVLAYLQQIVKVLTALENSKVNSDNPVTSQTPPNEQLP